MVVVVVVVVVLVVVVVDKSDEPDPCYCKNGSLPFLSLLPLPPPLPTVTKQFLELSGGS